MAAVSFVKKFDSQDISIQRQEEALRTLKKQMSKPGADLAGFFFQCLESFSAICATNARQQEFPGQEFFGIKRMSGDAHLVTELSSDGAEYFHHRAILDIFNAICERMPNFLTEESLEYFEANPKTYKQVDSTYASVEGPSIKSRLNYRFIDKKELDIIFKQWNIYRKKNKSLSPEELNLYLRKNHPEFYRDARVLETLLNAQATG